MDFNEIWYECCAIKGHPKLFSTISTNDTVDTGSCEVGTALTLLPEVVQ
jgi:hypothetical protein